MASTRPPTRRQWPHHYQHDNNASTTTPACWHWLSSPPACHLHPNNSDKDYDTPCSWSWVHVMSFFISLANYRYFNYRCQLQLPPPMQPVEQWCQHDNDNDDGMPMANAIVRRQQQHVNQYHWWLWWWQWWWPLWSWAQYLYPHLHQHLQDNQYDQHQHKASTMKMVTTGIAPALPPAQWWWPVWPASTWDQHQHNHNDDDQHHPWLWQPWLQVQHLHSNLCEDDGDDNDDHNDHNDSSVSTSTSTTNNYGDNVRDSNGNAGNASDKGN